MALSANDAAAFQADSKKIKALALDLDGTLLGPGGELSGRAIGAVKKCAERGLKIIIGTGRSIDAAERFRSSLGAAGPMIYFNGAVVADMPRGAVLRTSLLDKKPADFCIDFSRNSGDYYQIYIPESGTAGSASAPVISLITEKDMPGREMYYKHTGLLAELGDLKKALGRCGPEGCVKAMFIAEPERLEIIRPELAEALGESVYITKTHRNYLELMNAKASKGKGLKYVMELLSLKREEVIAFGDDENDAPMSDAAGFFIVPANAKDTVKTKADLITASNAEDGIPAFLEEFFGL